MNKNYKNRIKKILALAKKELVIWLYSPFFYGLLIFFLVFTSVWFYYLRHFFAMNSANLRPFFSSFPYAFTALVPVLTMRSWAEERKSLSEEILFSLPLSEWELVLGKFFSCLFVILIVLVLSFPVPLSLMPLGFFDPGVIFAEYLGSLLFAASAIALGLFLSSLCKSQGASFLSTAVILLLTNIISNLTPNLSLMFGNFLNTFSLSYHFESFSRGLLDSRDILFFLLSTLLFLFLNTRVLIFRKWS